MKNSMFIKTVYNMQNVPRWDEYGAHFKDDAASHSYRCASLALLALIVEKEFGKSFDRERVLGKALLHDLNETLTGSIKHVTKKEPFVKEHIEILEKEASEKIVSYLSKSLQKEFHDFIVNAEDSSAEGRLVDAIDTFDAMLFCYRETVFSSNRFFHEQYKKLKDKLESSEFVSIKWMLEEFDKKEGFYDFLNSILMMDTIARWKGNFNLVPDNDATHTFRATCLSIFNGKVEKNKYDKQGIDFYSLIGKTLFHDLVEAETGDILGPVKHSNPKIKQAFENYEKKAANRMINNLPMIFKEELEELMVDAKDASYEGVMCDISDKLDALIKSGLEMKNNPSGYEEKYFRQLRKIQHNFENDSVVFFLAYILHDLMHNMENS